MELKARKPTGADSTLTDCHVVLDCPVCEESLPIDGQSTVQEVSCFIVDHEKCEYPNDPDSKTWAPEKVSGYDQ